MSDILPLDASNQETLETRIMRHEGFCAVPKSDAKGMYVIGFGHDITKAECENYPNGVTWDDAEHMLDYDITIVKQNCAKEFPWILGLDYCRAEVIYEMAFQLGVNGVAEFKNMIAAIRGHAWNAAADAMLDSDWHQETPSRCEELAALMITGATT